MGSKLYDAEFIAEDGTHVSSQVAGKNEAEARAYAKGVAQRQGYKLGGVTLVERKECCHYCGMEATGHDIFGAPVCSDCR